jgi:hypothetical protein
MIALLNLIRRKPSSIIREEKTTNGIKLIRKPLHSTSSGNSMHIIPNDPGIALDKNESIRLVQLLSKRFPDKEIELQIDSRVSFVDCGDSFENICCPLCGKDIPMDYWQEAMDNADQKNFSDLEITMPCCGRFTNLNNLKYNQDCGFAKFILTINDPNTWEINEAELLNELETIYKINFRIIHAHI